ncbi:GumC family protein [Sphingomonas arenae]|uniref:GumC family protein n=1 Tax=Sphingomonas arenae TaxID=2812555 RepID=UPI001968001F|nr:Wzz/FepE/Etk N-terminal domain-containing protein [Sphingomonas arenae]
MGWFLNHLPTILWQRKLIIILSFLALSLVAVIAAYSLPTIYRSKATLLVQSQELPSDIVDAPATEIIDRRIARIRERVLSRGDLIGLIEQYDLYSEERRSQPMSVIVDKMREATTVGALEGAKNEGGDKGSNTIAFNMAFDYPDPGKAQAVLQSFVTRFLQMDTADIEDQASLTVRFLQDQAGKLQAEITQIENQITALKAANGATLTGGGMPMMMDTGSYTSQITALEAQNRQLMAQARRPASANPMLVEAEAALAAAQARYSDSHPDVIAARERLATVRSLAQAGGSSSENAMIQEQINANNAAIASLTRSRSEALARLQAQAANQSRAPVIMEEAMQMENRASTLRSQYAQVANNLLRAQNSARLASEQRSERLSLVEPPSLPDTPESPNRPLLIAAGAIVGLGIGFVLALGLELLARPLRSPAQIENMGYPVLGVVPTIQDQVRGQKRRFDFLFRRRKRFA